MSVPRSSARSTPSVAEPMDAAPFSGHNRSAVSFSASFPAHAGRVRLVAALAAVAAGAVLLAGCGGSAATVYTVAATRACLKQAGIAIVAVDEKIDVVAENALGGSLGAKIGQNRVTISFGRSDAEGSVIAGAYKQYGSRDVPIDQVLQQKRNAVLLWAGAPSPQDADAVRTCLNG